MDQNDNASDLEEMYREAARTHREPEQKRAGVCGNTGCGEPAMEHILPNGEKYIGAYCCRECGFDFERRNKRNNIRIC